MHPNTHSYTNLHTHKRLSNCNEIMKKEKNPPTQKKTKEEQCARKRAYYASKSLLKHGLWLYRNHKILISINFTIT